MAKFLIYYTEKKKRKNKAVKTFKSAMKFIKAKGKEITSVSVHKTYPNQIKPDKVIF